MRELKRGAVSLSKYPCILLKACCALTQRTIICCGVQMTYDCQALHGDITQANRESTLAGFKKGSFKVRRERVGSHGSRA